jgi:hypothetical protein
MPSGLVSWWTAENNAADIMTLNNASLHNGATFAPGMVGQAFSFDGIDDRVQMPDSESLKLTESLTIEAWVLVESFPTGNAGEILFRGDDRNGLDPYQLCVTRFGDLEFRIDSLEVRVVLNAPIALGQLTHVAATLDDATGAIQLYQNGTLVAASFTTVRPFRDLDPSSNPGAGIGNHGGFPGSGHNFPFHGLIDELSLYNRALTADEILGIYNAGADGKIQPTKFYVVNDSSAGETFEYAGSGGAIETYSLNSGNSTPRGAVSTAAGDKIWVVDANKSVYVYNTSGGLLGSWSAGGLHAQAQVEGIATNGTDIWLVDAKQDKVFKYTGAATRLSGSQNAASNFSLNSGNKNPKDLVTDGASIWVVDDSGTDKVFKYTVAGSLLGSWTISTGATSPTGITLDPGSPAHLWIVDNGADRVYQYDNAVSRTSGSQSASTSFALAAGNTNPQGIADPPAPLGLELPQSESPPEPLLGDAAPPIDWAALSQAFTEDEFAFKVGRPGTRSRR